MCSPTKIGRKKFSFFVNWILCLQWLVFILAWKRSNYTHLIIIQLLLRKCCNFISHFVFVFQINSSNVQDQKIVWWSYKVYSIQNLCTQTINKIWIFINLLRYRRANKKGHKSKNEKCAVKAFQCNICPITCVMTMDREPHASDSLFSIYYN